MSDTAYTDMNVIDAINELNRREFIRGSSFTAAMLAMGAVPIRAAEPAEGAKKDREVPHINIGVIGCGYWAREIIEKLVKLQNAPVALCDHYEAFLNRAKSQAPAAEVYSDYQKLLADKNVKAVIVATPSHLHKQIVLDALAAGKHVYCEAPVATTIDDSRAIAQAAGKAFKQHFQPGLLYRSDPQMKWLLEFVRTGAMGPPIKARSQWHKQNSWRKASPNPDREKELNWRLDKNLSVGLVGEIGIQQVDVGNWFYRATPVAVTGFGATIKWKDGREVPDSIQAAFEYPEDVLFTYEATLGNSFDGMLDVYYGGFATLMIRDGRAWMFKEPDAPLLGWEVYAQKNAFYKETGISLVTGASKLDKQLEKVTDPRPDDQGALYYALDAFIRNAVLVGGAVERFVADYGADDLVEMRKAVEAERKAAAAPAAGVEEGHEAAVAVIKANEAVMKRQRIAMSKEWFSL
jgi:predicted dehydrogenase